MGRNKNFDRNEVLEKAIQLFWRKGYADTSLSDLEKETGVNKSGLYSEFKDKEDIFLHAFKHYQNTTSKYQKLQQIPLGWNNIENMLHDALECTGQKGCFIANSIRDYNILPNSIRKQIQSNSVQYKEIIVANLSAAKAKGDHGTLADLISSFAAGVSLKLNAVKPQDVVHEIDAFLKLIKS